MNIIYSLSELEDWVEIAKHMQKNEDWNPVMWVSTDTLLSKIKETFPNCLLQEYMRGNRAEFDNTFLMKKAQPLDKRILEQYLRDEKIVLKMMDRVDPTRNNFNYNDRVEHYYTILTFWIYIFDMNSIDCVLFNEFPHSPFDYLLYAVAKQNKVKILRFAPTHIDSRTLLAGTLEDDIYYLNKNTINDTKLDKQLEKYIQKIEGNYKEAIPFYMRKITNKSISLKSLFKLFKQVIRYIAIPPQSPLKTKNSFVSNSRFAGLYMGFYRLKGNVYKKRLKNEYKSLTKEVDLFQKYIYLPLHYQPEKTTSPEGDFFVDQYLMIVMISKFLPNGWKIYIKEHISQFSTKLYGERGRDINFYKKLCKLDNIELVPLTYQSFNLIDNSQAVATVSGTAALESINRGKYAFIFGYPWFRKCEGIIFIEDNKTLEMYLNILESMGSPSKEKIESFFKNIEINSVRCYTAPGQNVSISNLTTKENIKNITSFLTEHVNIS